MKKIFLKIGSPLFVFIIFAILLASNTWAGLSKEPRIIRKKIVSQSEKLGVKNKFRAAEAGQKKPALKPRSEIILIPKNRADELTVPANSLIAQITPPAYNPKGKIDPFQPLFKDEPHVVSHKLIPIDAGRTNKTALEKMDLSQLKLTGIILAASGNKGLVQEASGRGHVISQGTYIGTRGGQVTGIQKNKVIIEEKLKDLYGKIYVAQKELRLNKVE